MRVLLLSKEQEGGLLAMLPSGAGQACALRPLSDPAGYNSLEAMAAAQHLARGEATVVDAAIFLSVAARLDCAALVQARVGWVGWGTGVGMPVLACRNGVMLPEYGKPAVLLPRPAGPTPCAE